MMHTRSMETNATWSEALAKAREEIRKYIPPGRDLTDALIQDRRAEVAQETKGEGT